MTRQRNSEAGFSMIEAVVAISILTVGLLTMAAVMTKTVQQTTAAGADLLAKDKAYEAIENIFAARDSGLLEWSKIRNVTGGDGGGVFVDGEKTIHEPGLDGIIGTADDASAAEQTMRNPGPNGALGDSDDKVTTLTQYKREIEIRRLKPESDSLRRVRVIVTYEAGGIKRRYELITLLSSYS
jgi:type II secretory pathway pseudopilin PulG